MASEQVNRALSPVAADSPVAIVSAFGRGNWLALELAQKGFRVTLIDVTESLGTVLPEDAEGPFGLFEAKDLTPMQKARLENEGELLPAKAGFTIWLEDGPVELLGPMSQTRLKSLGLCGEALSYVLRTDAPDRESERSLRELARQPFKTTWLAHLSHQLFSSRHEQNHKALELGNAAPLGARLSLRQVTQQGWRKGLAALRAAGVTVREHASVRDLRLNGRDVDALEIGDDHAGIERARAFVWLVSSNESKLLPKKLFEMIFPGGVAEPEWYWQRYRLKLDGERPVDELPSFAVLIDDVFLPWTQGNILIVRRRKEARSFDVWQKLPVLQLGNLESLAKQVVDIEARLTKRMPQFRPKLEVDLAQGSPAPQQLVFSEKVVEELETLRSGNFFFCGPERAESLDWLGQYRAQSVVLAKLEKMKSHWDAAARKAAAKEATT